jgi:hypothetical protein
MNSCRAGATISARFSSADCGRLLRAIHVTALCPGFTHSEFHDVIGTRDAADRLHI